MIMEFVLLLLIFLFGAAAFMNHMKKSSINAGALDPVIKRVVSSYKAVRDSREALETNVFAIGYGLREEGGTPAEDREKIAVRILDEKGKERKRAEETGMEVLEIGGRHYYQICQALDEKLSYEEMSALLVRIKDTLEARYPDELVSMAQSYLTVVVDGKKLLKMLEKGSSR